MPMLSPTVYRLVQRTLLLGQHDPARQAAYARFFADAIVLGEILHKIRECLEIWMIPPATSPLPLWNDMRAWENGLLLPTDFEQQTLLNMVRWYTHMIEPLGDNALFSLGAAAMLMSIEMRICVYTMRL